MHEALFYFRLMRATAPGSVDERRAAQRLERLLMVQPFRFFTPAIVKEAREALKS